MGFELTKWDRRWLVILGEMQGWSKDPSTQIACIIIRPDNSIVSYGVNNFPRGVADTIVRLENRAVKYRIVVHAEANALLHANEDLSKCTMYITHVPCTQEGTICASLIIQAGIRKVICKQPSEDYLRLEKGADGVKRPWAASIKFSLDLFKEAGVHCYWEGKNV